ncbi:MAG: tetratricopeptide repeat protein [Cytophagales bacterium]|nr:tetratricopeptide repeat protein [Cytophagales bacterium]
MAMRNITILILLFVPILVISQSGQRRPIWASLPTLANRYFSEADSFSKTFQYDSAIFFYQKASLIYEQLETWEDHVTCYNKIAENYYYKAQYSEAIQQLETGLKTGLERLGKEHNVIAVCYNAFGVIYQHIGQYDKALEYHQQSLQIKQLKPGNDHPEVAKSYLNMGTVYVSKGDYFTALEYFQRSLRIRQLNLDGERFFGSLYLY